MAKCSRRGELVRVYNKDREESGGRVTRRCRAYYTIYLSGENVFGSNPREIRGLPDLLGSLHPSSLPSFLPRSVIVRRFAGSRAGKIEQLPLSLSLSLSFFSPCVEEKGEIITRRFIFYFEAWRSVRVEDLLGRAQRFLKKDFSLSASSRYLLL